MILIMMVVMVMRLLLKTNKPHYSSVFFISVICELVRALIFIR